MGLRNTKPKKDSEVDIIFQSVKKLEDRINYLEEYNKVLEHNNKVLEDKIHTIENKYKNNNKKDLSKELKGAQNTICELEKQLHILSDLHKKKGLPFLNIFRRHDTINNDDNNNNDNDNSNVNLKNKSKAQIERIVNDLLNDESVNIKYFPDFVERQLYINVISMVIHLLEHFLSESNITFMGHQLSFDLKPVTDKDIINTDD